MCYYYTVKVCPKTFGVLLGQISASEGSGRNKMLIVPEVKSTICLKIVTQTVDSNDGVSVCFSFCFVFILSHQMTVAMIPSRTY